MVDYAQARRTMVDRQVRTADVTDLRILGALLEVPREAYVPAARQPIAYLDENVAVGAGGRALMKPMVFAKLLQAAGIGEGDHVLDIGCASGYSAAVLARLAGSVVALEEDVTLARGAGEALARTGATNLSVVSGPLQAGWPKGAPYDVIMIEGAVEVVSDSLLAQLKDGGRLVAVVGRAPMGKATVYRMASGHATAQPLFDATAPSLPGFVKPAEFVF
jgi:protein-L-isoaspartate(D-aspartate) O-methyltransferase